MFSALARMIRALLWILSRNLITIFGTTLTTFSFLMIATLLSLELSGILTSPYIGIIAFLVMPGLFVLGLVLIPIGAIVANRKDRKRGIESRPSQEPGFPRIDFNNPRTRQVVGMIVFLSLVNLGILGATSYGSVVYMDSTEFCGKVCHTVMEPEFVAHSNSPHSRVECVACHIGPGAPWFVKAKLSGVRQVFAVTFHTYDRPIPTPVENLRPSRDTCERCHWPTKFAGERMRVVTHFSDDETNTPSYTVLLMHIGGGNSEHGIHSWHIDPRRETSYISLDPQRQEIASVRVKEPDGKVYEFFANGTKPTAEQLAKGEVRSMDCIDCHNRPTHVMQTPADGVDTSLNDGRIDRTLPFIRKVAVEALTDAKGEKGDLEKIARKIESHFKDNYPQILETKKESVEKAIAEAQAIYKRNVFPEMNVTWNTYVNNIGHNNFPGCFRCHDGSHTTEDGSKTISNDCTLCHGVPAMDEQNPQVLADLGLVAPEGAVAEPAASTEPATTTEPAASTDATPPASESAAAVEPAAAAPAGAPDSTAPAAAPATTQQ